MGAVEGLLGAIRVVDPELVVEEPSGRATLDTGRRRSLLAVARGRLRLRGTELGPGDALLLQDGGTVPVVAEGPTTVVVARFALQGEIGRAHV